MEKSTGAEMRLLIRYIDGDFINDYIEQGWEVAFRGYYYGTKARMCCIASISIDVLEGRVKVKKVLRK
jgi:hypothetical protein